MCSVVTNKKRPHLIQVDFGANLSKIKATSSFPPLFIFLWISTGYYLLVFLSTHPVAHDVIKEIATSCCVLGSRSQRLNIKILLCRAQPLHLTSYKYQSKKVPLYLCIFPSAFFCFISVFFCINEKYSKIQKNSEILVQKKLKFLGVFSIFFSA